MRISAKTGAGVEELLQRLVEQVPPPVGDSNAPLRALVFDSYYDAYRGVVCYVRVVDGRLDSGRRFDLWLSSRIMTPTKSESSLLLRIEAHLARERSVT